MRPLAVTQNNSSLLFQCERQALRFIFLMDSRVDGWMDRFLDGNKDVWMDDRWMDGMMN